MLKTAIFEDIMISQTCNYKSNIKKWIIFEDQKWKGIKMFANKFF